MIRTPSAGQPAEISRPRRRSSRPAPTSIRSGSAASACPSGARRCSRRLPRTRVFGRSSRTGPAPLAARRPRTIGPRQVGRAPHIRRHHRRHCALLESVSATEPERPGRTDRAAVGLLHLCRARAAERDRPDAEVLRTGRRTEDAVAGSRRRPYARAVGKTPGVRAPGGGVLRPGVGGEPLMADRSAAAVWMGRAGIEPATLGSKSLLYQLSYRPSRASVALRSAARLARGPPSTSGQGRSPFKAVMRVRSRLGIPVCRSRGGLAASRESACLTSRRSAVRSCHRPQERAAERALSVRLVTRYSRPPCLRSLFRLAGRTGTVGGDGGPEEVGNQVDPDVAPLESPVTIAPIAMAGLNAPPEMPPTANAPMTTVNPMASP